MAKKIEAITLTSEITIEAAKPDSKGPRPFNSVIYTGGTLPLKNFELPVVIDLATLKTTKVLVANLDHEQTKRVGNFQVSNDGKQLSASGSASAATPSRDEVINSADDGYQWQASVEASPGKTELIKAGQTVNVNGQVHAGPIYVARNYTLKGFAFVSHGADDNTSVTIAATSANSKGNTMKAEVKAWAEAMGIDVDNATPEVIATIEANYEGRSGKKPAKADTVNDIIAAAREEDLRREQIASITAQAIADNPGRDGEFIKRLESLATNAIEAKWPAEKFDVEVLRATRPTHSFTNRSIANTRVNEKVIEAAICMTGKLGDVEKRFDDQTLQAAHDNFRNGIGLKQLMLLGAQAHGYSNNFGNDVTLDVQRAAFGMSGPRQINAAGFSTLNIPTVISNTANKFLLEGWNSIDTTILRIAAVRSVRDFKEITTVSLTGGLMFEKVGAAGEIKHGTLGELTYGGKADTYAVMLAITRQDLINDDIGALTSVPRRMGRGGALKLNDIGWAAFLDNASFFSSGNNNVNTGVADMTVGGLAATEAIFMAQTDPNGLPLGTMPAILVVPTALKAAATTLMTSEMLISGTSSITQGSGNIWRGRFRVESSPYMSNPAYTGYSASAWYMITDPQDLPVLEIVALNGRVEPVIETADADFNTLGVQMRGYSDVGVRKIEYRGGVRADGGSS